MALHTPTASASLATSAEPSVPLWKYDVFVSFRSQDKNEGFTAWLCRELQNREIKIFIDDGEYKKEERISQSILEAIQESRFAIVPLSKHYVTSAWCLDELTQIIHFMEIKETILPVFYNLDPSDVRNQTGSCGMAFHVHEKRFPDQEEKLTSWRQALSKTANIFGWNLQDESESEVIRQIVEYVRSKLTEFESMKDIETSKATDRTCKLLLLNYMHTELELKNQLKDDLHHFLGLKSAPRWKYDVFINFRGEDNPPKGFLSHLQDELQNTAKLNIVRDDKPLKRGRNIRSYLLMAIAESRLAIIILSKNFAASIWCLEELTKIFECMGKNRILPIFYHMDPSEVRRERGSFEQTLFEHEKRFQHEKDKVRRWRDVLKMLTNLPGFHARRYKYEGDLVKEVVKDICSKLVQFTDDSKLDQTRKGKDFEATEDAMDRTSRQPEPPVSVWKNDVFSGFTGDGTQRGFATHLGHDEIQNTTMTKTFTDDDHLERRDSSSSTSTSPRSSAERDPRLKYDVFLSFRGEDTRRGFLAHLYRGLQNTRVIKTFKDDVQLEKGTVIASSLLTAIEDSRFAVVVFSDNYASSPWCLDELKKIFECMKGKNTILPIFYNVDPDVVRHQKKETSYGKAFIKHETRHDIETINQWRAALKGVADISGWHSKNYPTDIELIEDIVKYLWKKELQAPTGNFKTFTATRQAMIEVMNVLEDDRFTVLGVHGVAGVGKTTMIKHVGAQAQKDGHFDHVVTVVVSKSPDLQELQGTLTDALRGNRVLIILDDVWENFELSSIGIPSPQELQMCHSKIVLTTRESNVCHAMGCHAQIPLDVLSEKDSWKLFKEMSGKTFHKSTDTISYKEARKVTGECGGLPKAIIAAARSLEDKYLDEWYEAVARVPFKDNCLDEWNEAAQTVNLEADNAYYSLESDDAKSCLLLCCLFPANYDILIEELLKYGIGKGLFQNYTMLEARDRAHSVVKYLKASKLLLDGTKKGCIKMTDDMRNLALSIPRSEEGNDFLVKPGCELEEWPEAEVGWTGWWDWWQGLIFSNVVDPHEAYSTISLMRNKLHTLPEYLECSELRILLLQGNAGICDIPKTFFQSLNGLEVLDLSFTGISSLPPSFSCLTNLQALNLDFCSNLSDVSDLGKLKKLVILSMRGLPLKKFPEQIGNLTSLRMLDVTGIYLETIPSKVISRLYRLEELHMKYQFGKWGSKIEDAVEETNAHFDELTGLLDLNILEVYISDAACLPETVGHFKPNWVEFDICIERNIDDVVPQQAINCCVESQYMLRQHDGISRILTLDTTISCLPVWCNSVLTEKVEKLEYRNCEDLNDVLGEYDHGNLLALKYLSVNGRHKNLKEIINTTTRVSNDPIFENLEELHLRGLYSLKELCVGELPPESLRKLKLLKVQTCRSLVGALLPSMLLQRLQNLEEIICVNLEGMKYVLGEGLDMEKEFLKKLREMRLSALSELVSICNGSAPHAIFQNLKVLAICECKELKYVFTIDVAECLSQLEDLSVEQCPSLIRVIEASNNLNREIKLPALKYLALKDLPMLTKFYTESGTVETACPSLKYLYVEKCDKFPYYHFNSKVVRFNDEEHSSSLEKRWKEEHERL